MYLVKDTGLSEPGKSILFGIPEGVAGVRTTLSVMRQLVRQYRADLTIRNFAADLVQNLPQKSFSAEARTLFEFVRDGVRYLKDVNDVETVQTPVVTLNARRGDCDDKATLLAALLESIGHPARFVAVGFKPGQFSHVYVETKIGPEWTALETTVPAPMGWKPPKIVESMIQKI